jgi:hypothetical protein
VSPLLVKERGKNHYFNTSFSLFSTPSPLSLVKERGEGVREKGVR